jgi:hypothetical protein
MIVRILFNNNIVRNYSDFQKWQIIVSIMQTMKKFPVMRNDDGNLNNENKSLRGSVSLVFPDDVKIMDPPA